ncbi:agmatinase [Ascoidea rubescens DSM 1968]|uniref:Arginase/deacetylase n=1 Tax=Ascoidea rubescens DSM 1968 TaxID=1344418 RepID=A0A1D2VMR9_9ASCO|nr:Arginase/deacetylase [Ascoidea rubescens DSM 1968]ODV62903.1 Arginase/deacetylase [Ascoidea rubescens DSM 1968]
MIIFFIFAFIFLSSFSICYCSSNDHNSHGHNSYNYDSNYRNELNNYGIIEAKLTQNDIYFSKSNPSLNDLWGQSFPFAGINTFAHLPYENCLLDTNISYDIALIGYPFDTATTYRPGARFGPRAIRSASQRINSLRSLNFRAGLNPFIQWANIIDCGDVPITPMDNAIALNQMTMGYNELLFKRQTSSSNPVSFPRLIMLGGDHSITLSALRNLYKIYGKLSIIHFDSHLDDWSPDKYPSFWHSKQSMFTHGSMLWMASKEGLLSNSSNVHAGIRTRLTDWSDYTDDDNQGFTRIEADDIFKHKNGLDYIINKILSTIPNHHPVYISVDIDVLDPSAAPGTGTPEPGGWLTRELIHIIRGIDSLNIVGADIVEVAPQYDHAEITAKAAVQVVYELITSMVKNGPQEIVKQNSTDTNPPNKVRNNLISNQLDHSISQIKQKLGDQSLTHQKKESVKSVLNQKLNQLKNDYENLIELLETIA